MWKQESAGSGQGPVTGLRGHDTEALCSINAGRFLALHH